MTANDPRPDGGYEPDEQTDRPLDSEALAGRLRDLADDIEDGSTLDATDVDAVLRDLERTSSILRSHLLDVDVESHIEDGDGPEFGEIDGDVDRLREAPDGEVARRLGEDVETLRLRAERVDMALYSGDLTDVEVEALWDAAGRIEAWSRDVLTFRTDRDLLTEPDGDRAVDLDALEPFDLGENDA